MEYRRFKDSIYIRLDTEDSILEKLSQICRTENIGLGSISGVGGISYAKLGVWNNQAARYDVLELQGRNMEIVGLAGNITLNQEEPVVHVHVTVADDEFHVYGGHLFEGVAQNTAEIVLRIDEGCVKRSHREYWSLMDFSEKGL